MRTRGGLAKAGVRGARNVRMLLSCLGALGTACLVGGLEVNPNLDESGSSGHSGNTGPTSNTSGSAGKASVGAGGLGGGEGGAPVSSAGSDTSPGAAGDGALPVGGDGPLGGAGAPSVDNCTGYSEQDDAGNAATQPEPLGSAEMTDQALGSGVEVCGQIDSGHFAGSGTVDIDSYRFEVPQASEAYLSLELASDVAETELVELTISSNGGPAERVRATRQDARWWVKLAAGYATVSVVVHSDAALTKPRKYLLRAEPDDIDVRCSAVSVGEADVTVSEAGDGADSTGNDVIRPSIAKAVQDLTAATDAVETTFARVGVGERGLITGSLAAAAHGAGDAYLDGDMYELRGMFIDQLTVRLDWQQSNADLDLWVFREDDLRAIGRTSSTAKTAPEIMTFSVEPITSYWIWIGATTQSTGLPKAYSLTVCGEAY